ncbi:MAG TPA: macro domain-containing protein [Ktedonobacteraceae bacterium]|nr:macro domain-containing protein [Ktedonobacteraceae bacterium]
MASIHYLKGDIFDSKAQVIVNTVNCKGVMGKGLALAFKQKYPDMFAVYERDCQTGKLQIGRPTIYQKSTPWILNFPTKNHWRFPSKLEYIEKGLIFLTKQYKKAGIESIAFPKLGAQNGQLSWDEVGPLMAKYLSQLDATVYIYIAEGDREYQYDPIADMRINEQIWRAFSELALSVDRLQQEVGLSSREAKKVAEKRLAAPFQSLADVENIVKIARTSIDKVEKFTQRYNMTELEGMPEKNEAPNEITKANKAPRKQVKKKKRPDTGMAVTASALFAL